MTLRVGSVLRGYEITTPFSTANSGNARWALASKGDRQYFIKEFLSPTYPIPGTPGSPATLADKRTRCDAFEARVNEVTEALANAVSDSGLVVATKEFFRHGTHYYRITSYIDGDHLGPESMRRLTPYSQVSVAIALLQCLSLLRARGVVHGDLRPNNLLVTTHENVVRLHLIDIDTCWIPKTQVVDATSIVGDPSFYSPEMLSMVHGDETRAITPASDVFAAGILLAFVLSDELPQGKTQRTAAGAVLAGEPITYYLPRALSEASAVVSEMIGREPDQRISPNMAKAAFQECRRLLPKVKAPTSGGRFNLRIDTVVDKGEPVTADAPHDMPPEALPPQPGSLESAEAHIAGGPDWQTGVLWLGAVGLSWRPAVLERAIALGELRLLMPAAIFFVASIVGWVLRFGVRLQGVGVGTRAIRRGFYLAAAALTIHSVLFTGSLRTMNASVGGRLLAPLPDAYESYSLAEKSSFDELAPGDCLLALQESTAIRSSCDKPHKYDVLALESVSASADAPHPTMEEFRAIGKELCGDADFVAIGRARWEVGPLSRLLLCLYSE